MPSPLYFQFLYQMACFTKLLDNKEHITHIDPNAALHIGLENNITAHGFPVSIERQSQQFAFAIVMSLFEIKQTFMSPFVSA